MKNKYKYTSYKNRFEEFCYDRWRDIKDFWYYLRNRFWDKYHILKLRDKPGWIDERVQVELALEKIFLNFYAVHNNFIDWNHHEAARKTKSNYDLIYQWLTIDRPVKQKQYDDLLEKHFEPKSEMSVLDYLTTERSEEENKEIEFMHTLEEEIDDKNTEIYKLIVQERFAMWT